MDRINMTLEKSALILVVVYLLVVFHVAVRTQYADDGTGIKGHELSTTEQPSESEPRDQIIEDAILDFEKNAAEYEVDDEYNYDELINSANTIINLMNNPNKVYEFLKQKGIERVIIPNLDTFNADLKTRLLMLTKIIFDIAPTATSLTIPVNTIDKLLDIFEYGTTAMKAHVLDIMYLWLPGYPKVQARVMKIKGLEPFYEQIATLDTVTSQVLLDLFNKILIEHLEARDENKDKTTKDLMNLGIYKRIGLVERMSTPRVCKGLLSVFDTVLHYNDGRDMGLFMPVLELIKNLKPFCLEHYKGKIRAFNVFQHYLNIVKKMETNEISLDKTELLSVLQDYVDVLRPTILKEDL